MKILKMIGAVFCGLMVLAGVINTTAPSLSSSRVENAILTFVFLIFTVLLIRSIRKGAAKQSKTNMAGAVNHSSYTYHPKSQSKVSPYLPEIPAETLRDMRKHYTAVQIQNDMRIMQESFQLVQQTTDFDTFFTRLGLSQQKALTLLQAVQAGCRGIPNRQQTIKGCEAVLSNTQNAKLVFLDNSYKKETSSALQLKTKSGQYKRLVTYMDRLKSYEEKFTDVQETYDGVILNLQNLISERQPTAPSPVSHSKSASWDASADEIMKFKQLLDAGAITQEEYDAKKSQLLGL